VLPIGKVLKDAASWPSKDALRADLATSRKLWQSACDRLREALAKEKAAKSELAFARDHFKVIVQGMNRAIQKRNQRIEILRAEVGRLERELRGQP
jgi:septal ring factor EnvC (AmiA/AmiB activator)